MIPICVPRVGLGAWGCFLSSIWLRSHQQSYKTHSKLQIMTCCCSVANQYAILHYMYLNTNGWVQTQLQWLVKNCGQHRRFSLTLKFDNSSATTIQEDMKFCVVVTTGERVWNPAKSINGQRLWPQTTDWITKIVNAGQYMWLPKIVSWLAALSSKYDSTYRGTN